MADNHIKEAARQLTICNACRYCEGYCAVWDAMERRTEFYKKDVDYMANLCHDCRECLYVCPFTEPHEFGLNIPKVLAEVRYDTYKENTKPSFASRAFDKSWALPMAVVFASMLGILAIAYGNGATPLLVQPISGFSGIMSAVFVKYSSLFVYLFVIILWSIEGMSYWRSIGESYSSALNARATYAALKDVFLHRFFRGGGAGCNYPGEKAGMARLLAHPLVIFGFLIALFSFLPYPNLSTYVEIAYGTGCAMLFAGTAMLLYMKLVSNKVPSYKRMNSLDYPFTIMLNLTGITGVAMILDIGHPFAGLIFAIHMSIIFTVFITAPYGKFVHLVFRYEALLKNRIEEQKQ